MSTVRISVVQYRRSAEVIARMGVHGGGKVVYSHRVNVAGFADIDAAVDALRCLGYHCVLDSSSAVLLMTIEEYNRLMRGGVIG